MNFGFSYVGLIYLLMLFIPNGLWAKHKPEGYDEIVKNEKLIFAVFEKTGQFMTTGTVLIFSDFNIRLSLWALILLASFAFMALYEIYWIRYFKSERKLSDFYTSICGIPLAGATLPVIAFFILGIYGKNPILLCSTLLLGTGHIGIHFDHYKESLEADN